MHFTEYDTRLAAYAVIVNEADEILLTWYNGEGMLAPKWTLPGGGVEFDEAVADAVVREVYEESGYHVEVGPLLAAPHFTLMNSDELARPFRSQRFLYAAAIVGGQLGTTEVGGTTDLARWVPLGAVRDLAEERADIVDLAVSLAHREVVPRSDR
ncbi:MAG: NUDIX domain-containing protein [Actinobacteria bacterium]|nr:NUDIX domain-containing protein [Actinomycetota bacterium]